jgi:lambda repressor-like predicted transcriptional regulator
MELSMDVVTWTRADLVRALRLKGYTVRRLAAEVGLTYPATRYSLLTGLSEKVRDRVCEILSLDARSVWPQAFPPQWGNPKPPSEATKK